jgi:hypothetical protein
MIRKPEVRSATGAGDGFRHRGQPCLFDGAFDLMKWMIESQDQVQAVFETGGGVPWSDHTSCLFCAVGRFFRPGYHNNLVSNWLPALDGVVEKLKLGAKVADLGCDHGWSTVIMARAFPNSQFVGYDFHPSSSKATPRRRGWFLLNTVVPTAPIHLCCSW